MTVMVRDEHQAPAGTCPRWCDGSHPITDEGVYHCAEIGRLDSGELALVVSVAHWIPLDGDDNGPEITLSWEEDGHVNLLEGIALEPEDGLALVPLLAKANAILSGRQEQEENTR